MSSNTRIFAFHLLNDRSGSPKVLSQIIRSWVSEDREVHLYTSLHQDGFLSNIQGVHYHRGWYHFKANQWLRLVYYTLSQVILFAKMFSKLKKGDTVYINTVLPFGAALLGKLKGCRIIYHIHESSVSPAVLKWFLFKIIALTANELINVSAFVQQAHGITTVPNHLIYNSIDDTFLNKVQPPEKKKKHGHVLMVCSLKIYKGINEFVLLAQDNPGYDFQLVVNASPTEISLFFSKQILPDNLTVFPAQKNLHPFFQWADIILNLSKPDSWIETFGLTIIEGMAYGLPAIVPPVGGILEVIKDGVTGFAVDSRDRNELNNCLHELLENASLYTSFSTAATSRLYLFKEKTMIEKVNQVVF